MIIIPSSKKTTSQSMPVSWEKNASFDPDHHHHRGTTKSGDQVVNAFSRNQYVGDDKDSDRDKDHDRAPAEIRWR
jgi:hypothetical protein